jgi:hypothetical protein
MAIKTLENFYKTTISTAWATGTGNRYIATLPSASTGRLVINPANSTKREIVEYSAKGTDGGGNYITLSVRGVGGTTDQTHDVNEAVRSNITAEVITDIQTELDSKMDDTQIDTDGTLAANSDTKLASQKATKTYADTKMPASYLDTDATMAANSDTKVSSQKAAKTYMDALAIAGAPDASETVKGIVEIATDAEVESNDDTGSTTAPLVVKPSQLGLKTLVAGEDITANDTLFVAKGDESRRLNAYSATHTTTEQISGNTWIYQSFTTGPNTTSVTRIKLWVGSTGNSPANNGTVRLRATANGADIVTGTFGFGAQNSNGEQIIDITDTVVTPNTTYYLVVSVGTDAFTNYYVYGGTTTSYSGGVSGISANAGSTWASPSTSVTGDFYFEVLEGNYVAGKVYKTVAATDYYAGAGQTINFIGFAISTVLSGASIPIRITGNKSGLSGLTPGLTYYLSNTPGAIASSAGTVSKKVGIALSATDLLIKHDN